MRGALLGALIVAAAVGLASSPACAEPKSYDAGATDSEIKVGNTAPYTGRFAEYGAEARAEAAYFTMINERGGIHGRKVTFVSVDDGSNVQQAVELTHRLVEQDGVLLMFASFGTEQNLASRDYLNTGRIPQLFIATNSALFDDPAHFPWTMGFFASARSEGSAYARYIEQMKPAAKIAILVGSGAAGQEYVDGVREGLGAGAATMIVKEASFRYADPVSSIDTQVQALRDSGADVLLNLATGRYASEAIRATFAGGWHPLQFIPNNALSVRSFLDPAGLAAATGIVSNARSKGWLEGQAERDPAVAAFVDWMHRYNPQADLRDQLNVAGYERAQTLVDVLTRCGDDLTRANVIKQAASLDLELGMLRPGIKITTSRADYAPIKQLYMIRFDGKDWVPVGAPI